MKPLLKLELREGDRETLEARRDSHTLPFRDVFRAGIVLARADGFSQKQTALRCHTSEVTVQRWTNRYRQSGIEGLHDRPGRGRKARLPATIPDRILSEATTPPPGKTRHSTRTMARMLGVSNSYVHAIWKRGGIKPHLTRIFKVSTDPHFVSKFWDISGLYLHPPEKAVVFCCDEKTQCQALERTQPCLPLNAGHILTQTHDYIRHGTTTLFAALDYATGKVLHRTSSAHTHKEWLAFLKQIDRNTPEGLDIHVIADNYATHKHAAVRKWLGRHKRFHMHFTPTSSSWMNLVERFFGEITRECIRNDSFGSVRELEAAIDEHIRRRNEAPTRFVWKAERLAILEKINRARGQLGLAPHALANPNNPSKGNVISRTPH